MSQNRQPAVAPRRLTAEQEPFLVARALRTTYSNGYVIHTHAHEAHQLLFASSGAMTVTGDRTTWMIPPGRAVLISAGTPHSIHMWGEVAMRSLYFPLSARAPVFDTATCRVISVTPLPVSGGDRDELWTGTRRVRWPAPQPRADSEPETHRRVQLRTAAREMSGRSCRACLCERRTTPVRAWCHPTRLCGSVRHRCRERHQG